MSRERRKLQAASAAKTTDTPATVPTDAPTATPIAMPTAAPVTTPTEAPADCVHDDGVDHDADGVPDGVPAATAALAIPDGLPNDAADQDAVNVFKSFVTATSVFGFTGALAAAAGSTDNLVFVNGHGQYTPTVTIDTGTDADVTVDTTSGGAATLDFLRADFGNAQTAVNLQITKPIIGGSILTLSGRRCKVMSVGTTAADGQTFTTFCGANNDYNCLLVSAASASATCLRDRSLAPPATALAEPVAPEPPPPAAATTSEVPLYQPLSTTPIAASYSSKGMFGHNAGKCDYFGDYGGTVCVCVPHPNGRSGHGTCESTKKCKYGVDPFFCGCAYDVITQTAAIQLDSAPARCEYMAPPTTALAEPVATGGKAPTAGATDAGTTGDSYSRLLASGAASDRAHGSCHTSVSASAMHISSCSLAPPTTTLAEPIAPEPPPPTLAPVSTALCPQRPRFRHTPQRLRQVQLRRLRP